jgi:hypothetical protein
MTANTFFRIFLFFTFFWILEKYFVKKKGHDWVTIIKTLISVYNNMDLPKINN